MHQPAKFFDQNANLIANIATHAEHMYNWGIRTKEDDFGKFRT